MSPLPSPLPIKIRESENMLKINPLAFTLVFLQTIVHHAFVPKTNPCIYAANSKSGVSTIRSFSTILAESDRDIVSVKNENIQSFKVAGAESDEYEYSINEMTRQLLSDSEEDGASYDDNGSMVLTTNSILSMLTHHSKRKTVDGAETIEKILDRLEERLDSEENLVYKLHCGHYTIAVTAWSRSGHPNSAERATRIVNRMKERNIELNEVTYNTWMNAYVIQNNISKVEEILKDMEEKIPNEIRVKDYNILILANARQGRAKDAEQIVKSMVDRYSSGASLVLPDLITYSMLLDAWSKSEEEGRGVRAEKILDSIEERQISFDTTAYNNPELTISGTYVAAMRAIIHSGEHNIVERVESIYKRAVERGITPDAYVYATLLDAYATTRPTDASEKVPEILAMMEENVTNINFEGKTVVYNTALKLLKESREPNAIAKAEKLFQKMKSQGTFDEVTYGTMIALYTNNNGESNHSSAKRAEELLNEMINEKGLEANTHHMNSSMNSLIRAGNISKAADLLDKMEEEYINGNDFMKPNVVSYATLMNGWVKSNDPQKSKQTTMVFDKMKMMFKSGNKAAQPNFVSYVTLVDCIVKSGEVGAAERAEKVVKNMYQTYTLGESSFKPNAQLVSTVIDCWSKSGDNNAGERAEMLLNWLFEIYEEDKDPKLMPSAYPFTSSITAWAKSRKFGKAARAKAILDKMKVLFTSGVIKSPPNIYCYTAVINACAYTERDSIEQRDALQVFVTTYKEMINEEDVVPNNVTFFTVLTALRTLLPADEKRADAVGTVFKKCVELGMCNPSVTKRLQSVLTTKQLKDLVGGEKVNESGIVNNTLIPMEWTRNVKSGPKKKITTK